MKKELINHFTWLVNSAAQCVTYNTWSNESKARQLQEAFDTFYTSAKNNLKIDLKEMTIDELKEMRFCRWSDEKPGLWLIPLWFVPLLPIGIELTDIFGKTVIYDGNNIDLDVRYGCIAYGIIKKSDTQ